MALNRLIKENLIPLLDNLERKGPTNSGFI